MAVWTEIINRIRYLFRRSDFDEELDTEIEFHVAARAQELERDGLPASRASVQARHESGSTAQMREETYDAWQFRLLEDLAADLRYAARSLLRSPGFTAVAVLSLTLGIGANSTVFALVKAVLLPSIPVKSPASLASLNMTDERNREPGEQFMPLSYLNAEDCRERNHVFSGMAIVLSSGADMQLSSTRIPVWVSLVSGNFFDVLGVRAELGRAFLPDEDRPSAARPVVVLSHAFWNRQFAADPKIVGQSVRLNDQDYAVIGVAASGFHGAPGSGNVDLWVPMAMNAHVLGGRDFRDEALSGAKDVAVVNEELAARFWPDQYPIGKRIRFVARTSPSEVIGLVGTVKLDTLGESPQPAIYVPLDAQKAGTVVLYVRATGDEGRAEANVRAKVQSLASGVPVLYAVPVQQIVRGSLFPARMAAESLSVFGALALMLASIGTYGVMSYSVSQRTQEIGIRMVLGAQPRDVLRLIVRGGIGLVVAGILAGLALAAILARGLSSLLYGIGGFDAEVSLVVAGILILSAFVACRIPARRAMRADPMIALRYE